MSGTAMIEVAVMAVQWFYFRKPTSGSWWVSTCAFISRIAIFQAALTMLVMAAIESLSSKHRFSAVTV